MKKALFVFLYSLFMGTSLNAQYRLEGRILDQSNSVGLIGATIGVEGTTMGAISELEGRFSLEDISIDRGTLVIQFLGYETVRMEVDFSETNAELIIQMEASSIALEEVTVSGIAEGQIKAFIDMKRAENIKNIISAEQILTFPDLNAAEVLQRIPGITLQRDQGEGRFVQLRGTPPELTNFNINGEQVPSPEGGVRYVGMDIIPSDQIEAVEVTKVMTPDMDGDGIGGSVNIETKTAQEGDPEFHVTLSGGYSNLRQKPNYNAQLAFGQRFNKLGFQLNASFFENNQGADNIEYKFAKGPFFSSDNQQEGRDNFFVHYREVQLRHYDITRTRISVSPTIDYKFSEHSNVYLRGMYNSFSDYEVRRRLIYDLDDPLNATYYLFGGVEHDVKDRTKRQGLATISLGGEHKLGNVELDYQLFFAQASETEPDRIEARFDSPGQAITIDFDISDPDFPVATFPRESNAGNVTDYENYELDEMLLENRNTEERLLTPRFNLLVPYTLERSNGYFKVGAKLRSRVKERDIRTQNFGAYNTTSRLYPGEGDPLNLITIVDNFREDNLLDRGYVLNNMPSGDKLRDFYEFFPQYFILSRNDSRKDSYNQDYTYRENIYAGYAMLRHNFDNLMVLAGLRYELTDITQNDGFGVRLDGNKFLGIDTLVNQNRYEFLLPQIQIKYNLTPKVNLRAAFTTSYSRPNYDDVIPSREEDRKEVSVGNPDLRFPKSLNFDLLIERYHNRSIFSAGVFYKKIDDFVFSYKRFGREGAPGSGNYPIFEFTKPLNGKDAKVLGAEVQAQFKFDFFDNFLKNFGLFTNYTYSYSQAFIPKRSPANYASAVILDPLNDDLSIFFEQDGQEEISLPGQAEHTTNIGLFYDSNAFFARLTANYQDEFLIEIGPDPDLDEYYDQALRFDFTMNFRINDKIKVFGDWINITNTALRYYLGTPDVIKQNEFYSWWGRLGIRWDLL